MKSIWSILIGLAVLTVGIVPGSTLASDRNGTVWSKQTNFNTPQPRRAIVEIVKRTKPAHVARASSPRKEPEPPTNRVLATFELDQDALALVPPGEPITAVKPTPGKC